MNSIRAANKLPPNVNPDNPPDNVFNMFNVLNVLNAFNVFNVFNSLNRTQISKLYCYTLSNRIPLTPQPLCTRGRNIRVFNKEMPDTASMDFEVFGHVIKAWRGEDYQLSTAPLAGKHHHPRE